MIEADFGGKGPVPAQAPGAGEETTGPGVAPGARARSSQPRPAAPEAIRAILAGIARPGPAVPTAPSLTVLRPSEVPPTTPADPGALSLASVDVVLPHILESAMAAGRQLTVVSARPGPAATPDVRLAPASPGEVADLAAALAVSLGPDQDLLADGTDHLVVTTLGGGARRDTAALMQRAAEAGAPMFTWAAARFPRDAQSAADLLDLARARVDGTEPVVEGDGRHKAWAVWAGVAAALLVAAFALLVHGHGSPQPPGRLGDHHAATGSPGGATSLSGTGGSSGAADAAESVSGGSGRAGSVPANGGTGSSGAGAGSSGAGAGSSGNGAGGSGSGSGSGSTATSLPSSSAGGAPGNTTGTTTVGNTTGTTTAGNTTGTTTANSTSPTTTTTVCSSYTYLLGKLVCTVGGLLGGH